MIRINLLPTKKRKKKAQPIPAHFVFMGLMIGVVCVVLGLYWMHLNGKISDMKADKQAKEIKLADLQVQLKEVENYEKAIAIFKEKAAAIEKLKKSQGIPLMLLEQVSEHLSKGVWLTSLKNSGMGVSLKGIAFTNTELVAYIQNLKGSKNLTGVTPIESRQGKMGKISIYKFSLKLQMKV
ncbi:MAG TPA: hypothetical protein ENH40_06865 [Nitrospirae bacterium]|nr:hypothetical protein [Nitrospirota bacterium]